MVDFGGSATLNIGASGSGAISASASNANPQLVSNQSRAVFDLRGRALASERGQVQQQNQQIDPALLARIALEEELKRRGGGGGGVRSFNPLTFVPYSFTLLAKAIDQARAAFNQALAQGIPLPAPITNAVQTVQNYVAGVFNSPLVANLNTAINQSFAQIANAIRNPLTTAQNVAMNVVQLANVIASAVAAGLKKIFAGKEEDRFDPDNEYFQEEDGFLRRVWGMFANVGNDANQSNSRNIKSHIDNLAKQVTKWSSAMTSPFHDFRKRWFN